MRTQSRASRPHRRGTRAAGLILLSLTMAVVVVRPVARAAEGQAPLAAVIAGDELGLSESAVVAFLEARLSQGGRVRLVERQLIDAILDEQALSAAFGAGDVGSRVQLGRLLKADLLILLRGGRVGGKRRISVLVAETSSGLRLLAQPVPWTDDPAADVAAILALVDRALIKYPADNLAVVAVPQFVSNDLTHRWDGLQSTYARLIEQVVLSDPGFVAVAMREAQAISEEFGLTQPGGRVERRLPYYVLGEYRHDEQAGAVHVSVALELKHGQETVKRVVREGMDPTTVPAFLHEQAREMLAALGGGALPATDPARDAEQLAGRAREFYSIGEWARGLDLSEASLLLRTDRPAVHGEAATALVSLAERQVEPRLDAAGDAPRAAEALACTRRAIPHLGAFLGSGETDLRDNHYLIRRTLQVALQVNGYLYRGGPTPRWFAEEGEGGPNRDEIAGCGEIYDALAECVSEWNDMMCRVLDARAGGIETLSLHPLLTNATLRHGETSAQDNIAAKRRFVEILAAKGVSKGEQGTLVFLLQDLALRSGVPGQAQAPEFKGLIDAIASVPGEAGPEAAAGIRAELAREKSRGVQRAHRAWAEAGQDGGRPEAAAPTGGAPTSVVLRALSLEWRDLATGKTRGPDRLVGWLRCGPDNDLAWGLTDLYLMRQKGVLERVMGVGKIQDVCFDGRFVWVASTGRPGGLIVVDPADGRSWALRGREGILPANLTCRMAPVREGSVCVAGCFGPSAASRRMWIGVVDFDGAGGATVRLIHGARQVREAFTPWAMMRLSPPDRPDECRIIVVRGREACYAIDSEQGSFDLVPDLIVSIPDARRLTVHEGSAYWIEVNRKGRPVLMRLDFPGHGKVLVAEAAQDQWRLCRPVFLDGVLHVGGTEWWYRESPDRPFRSLTLSATGSDKDLAAGVFPGGPLRPEIVAAARQAALYDMIPHLSNHYGLIALGRGQFRIILPETPATLQAQPGQGTVPGDTAVLTPIDTKAWTDVDSGRKVDLAQGFGWIACPPDLDIVWCAGRLYRMEGRGKLRRIDLGRGSSVSALASDGQYLWLADNAESRRITVLEVRGPGRWHFTQEDGLPLWSSRLAVGAIGGGRACVAGYRKLRNGTTRTWVAILAIEHGGEKAIDLVYNATQPTTAILGPWAKKDTASYVFRPAETAVLGGPNGRPGSLAVVMGDLDLKAAGTSRHAVLVDTVARTVQALPVRVAETWALNPTDGQLYWLASDSRNVNTHVLMRLDVAQRTGRITASGIGTRSRYDLAFLGGCVHAVGTSWWWADTPGGPFRDLPTNVPELKEYAGNSVSFVDSCHYGPVLRAGGGRNFQVRLPGSPD
jgi:hypothetical protein